MSRTTSITSASQSLQLDVEDAERRRPQGDTPDMARRQAPQALEPLVDAFITQRRVLGRSASTIAMYEYWLLPLAREVKDTGALDSLAVTRTLSRLRERNLSPFTVFQAYSVTKIFCRWLVGTGALRSNPCDGLHVRPPRTLPEPPTAEELRKVLAACDRTTFEGARNYAIVLTLCDSGARRASLLRLLVQDWNPSDRSLFIRQGKGGKDNVAFVGPTTARAIRDYLLMRPPFDPFDFLFVDARNRPLKGRNLLQILHRLSAKAGLPPRRRLYVHACRHAAGTAWARDGLTMEEIRRLLGHTSYATSAKYVHLSGGDLRAAHRRASSVERMLLG